MDPLRHDRAVLTTYAHIGLNTKNCAAPTVLLFFSIVPSAYAFSAQSAPRAALG